MAYTVGLRSRIVALSLVLACAGPTHAGAESVVTALEMPDCIQPARAMRTGRAVRDEMRERHRRSDKFVE